MAIVVHVEQLNQDKTLGITTNHAMMLENAAKFRITNLEPHDDYTALSFQAGRYICVIAMDANKELGMTFIDLKNNEDLAKKIATQYEEELRRIFMKTFYELSKNYKRNYDLVRLELGKGFPDNISAN